MQKGAGLLASFGMWRDDYVIDEVVALRSLGPVAGGVLEPSATAQAKGGKRRIQSFTGPPELHFLVY
jgi:hypothetical protein